MKEAHLWLCIFRNHPHNWPIIWSGKDGDAFSIVCDLVALRLNLVTSDDVFCDTAKQKPVETKLKLITTTNLHHKKIKAETRKILQARKSLVTITRSTFALILTKLYKTKEGLTKIVIFAELFRYIRAKLYTNSTLTWWSTRLWGMISQCYLTSLQVIWRLSYARGDENSRQIEVSLPYKRRIHTSGCGSDHNNSHIRPAK